LPGKICINCGYDPSQPGVRPTSKPAIPEAPQQETKSDLLASFRDMFQSAEKKSKGKQKDKAAAQASRTAFSDADDILSQIDKLGPAAQPASTVHAQPASQRPAAQATPPPPQPAVQPTTPSPPLPQRSTLQQAFVPVTTQFVFEGQRIAGYAGLVAATVVVRVGEPDELLPEGQHIQRLSGGVIGLRLRKAIDLAIADLKTEALERGGNGVVGARLEMLPAQGPLAIVTLIGTAVILE
jgi:uncharacterized protein YbjQ (UPF0145 family)